MSRGQEQTHRGVRDRVTANGVRISLLVAIATLGVYLGAPAVMKAGFDNGMPDVQRQLVLVALLELIVAAGTLTYFSASRPTYERVIGALLVIGALSVTVTAGVKVYGLLGFIAPVAYLVAAHLTAAPRQVKKTEPSETKQAEAVAQPWVGEANEVAPRESIQPEMAAIEPPRPQPEPDAFAVEPPVNEDETVTRLRALRAQHGWQAEAKERDALKVGWPKIRAARAALETEAK